MSTDLGHRLTVLVLAKVPRPGYSKTRLIPAFGPDGAAALAAAALADTLVAVGRCPGVRRVLVLAGDRSELPDSCRVNGFRVVPQIDGDHVGRIVAAFETAPGPALLIGMDTPQLDPAVLGLDLSASADAWFGPAEDGGWWALGLRRPDRDARRVLTGVPMSTGRTGELTLASLRNNGLRVTHLPILRDVDEPQDAVRVAELAPGTGFAACLRDLHGEQVGVAGPGRSVGAAP